MPGQQIAEANPPPDASLLPDSVLDYGVQLENKHVLSKHELTAVHKFRRAADYVAAGEHNGNWRLKFPSEILPSYDFPEIQRLA